ncbi:MAG: hypothetical protein IT516_06825 [Burkholderiales bacterium]|nr:hypothetical protein [Burkholderiales bacterium]
MRDRPYLTFFLVAAVVFLTMTVAGGIAARIIVGGQGAAAAASDQIHDVFAQATGTLFLASPFLALAWLSASLARRVGLAAGLRLFLFGALLLGFLYVSAQFDSERYMARRGWTAAALAIGLLPVKSVPVLLLCAVLAWLGVRKHRAHRT